MINKKEIFTHQAIEKNKLVLDSGKESIEKIQSLAKIPIDITIEGETGTGKDTLAKKIHEYSGRQGRFVAINCAALPEMLIESELFGVKAGAYTGASNSRMGLIEASNQGTLYLDEVDSMPLYLQAKLLRSLEERTIVRLGSTDIVHLDLRVISSTKKPMYQLVLEGIFRIDLMYRLSAVNLFLPSLRQNRTEINSLFTKFMMEFSNRVKISPPPIHPQLIRELEKYSWPGNIRELKFMAERYAIGLPIFEEQEFIPRKSLKHRLIECEIQIIKEALELNRGSLEAVANDLMLPKRTLYYKLNKLRIFEQYKSMKNRGTRDH